MFKVVRGIFCWFKFCIFIDGNIKVWRRVGVDIENLFLVI